MDCLSFETGSRVLRAWWPGPLTLVGNLCPAMSGSQQPRSHFHFSSYYDSKAISRLIIIYHYPILSRYNIPIVFSQGGLSRQSCELCTCQDSTHFIFNNWCFYDLFLGWFQCIFPFKHTKLLFQGSKFELDYCSVDLIKGYARASVIAFVVMVAAEIDLDTDYDKVKPFEAFLDRAFLLPSNVSGHYLEKRSY